MLLFKLKDIAIRPLLHLQAAKNPQTFDAQRHQSAAGHAMFGVENARIQRSDAAGKRALGSEHVSAAPVQ